MINFEDLDYYDKCTYIVLNFEFAISLIGIVANTCVFCVFLRKRFKNISFCVYVQDNGRLGYSCSDRRPPSLACLSFLMQT